MKIIQRSVAMISIFLLLFTSFPLDVFLATENMDNEVCEIIEDDANELNINQAGDYYVYSKDDLVEISNIVNSGNNLAGKTIYICQDIDMAGINWIPIGNQQYSFCGSIGTIDGTVKYIKNLTVNSQ